MRHLRRWALFGFVLLSLVLVLPLEPAAGASLKLYVAASTKEAVSAVVRRFEAKTGFSVEVSPGSSSKLAKQIVEGAPADLFLSADEANVDYLGEKKLIARRRTLLRNRMVVVVPADSPTEIKRLADLGDDQLRQVALAIEKVPAGEYARQALRSAGVWQQVEPKLIGGEDVRATLAFVERGAAAGIVYRTDTMGNSRVRIALEIDPNLHRPIEYPLVLTKRAIGKPQALQLYEYLGSAEAAAEFRMANFLVDS